MGKKNRKKKEQALKTEAPGIYQHSKRPKQKIAIAFLVSLLAFGLYANTLNHDYAFDDALVVNQNDLVKQGVSAIPEILRTNYVAGVQQGTSTMYRPFTLAMLAWE